MDELKRQEHTPKKAKLHAEMKGNKSTKNPNKMQMTKRRRNNELIKKTAPCTKEKTTMKCNHTQSLKKRSTNGQIKKIRECPNKEDNSMLK